MVTSNGGPSSSGQQNLFKNKIFGVYHLSKIDANGNAIYKKASAVSGLVADKDVHFHIFKGDIGWMVMKLSFDQESGQKNNRSLPPII